MTESSSFSSSSSSSIWAMRRLRPVGLSQDSAVAHFLARYRCVSRGTRQQDPFAQSQSKTRTTTKDEDASGRAVTAPPSSLSGLIDPDLRIELAIEKLLQFMR